MPQRCRPGKGPDHQMLGEPLTGHSPICTKRPVQQFACLSGYWPHGSYYLMCFFPSVAYLSDSSASLHLLPASLTRVFKAACCGGRNVAEHWHLCPGVRIPVVLPSSCLWSLKLSQVLDFLILKFRRNDTKSLSNQNRNGIWRAHRPVRGTEQLFSKWELLLLLFA